MAGYMCGPGIYLGGYKEPDICVRPPQGLGNVVWRKYGWIKGYNSSFASAIDPDVTCRSFPGQDANGSNLCGKKLSVLLVRKSKYHHILITKQTTAKYHQTTGKTTAKYNTTDLDLDYRKGKYEDNRFLHIACPSQRWPPPAGWTTSPPGPASSTRSSPRPPRCCTTARPAPSCR